MRLRQIYSLPYWLLCVAGLLLQATQLTNDYLRYETASKIHVEFSEFIDPPLISVCTLVGEIIDVENAVKSKLKFDHVWQFHADVFNNITLRQMFEMTPTADDVLINCGARLPGRYVFQLFGRSMCYNIFRMKRYFMQERICYMADLNTTDKYNFAQVSQAAMFSGAAYVLGLNTTLFDRATFVWNIVHPAGVPHTSRYSAGDIRRKVRDSKDSENTYFRYTYSEFVYKLLPLPYETACGTNQGLSGFECRQQCMNKGLLERIGSLPTSWIIEEDSAIDLNQKLLTAQDLATNETKLNEYLTVESECNKKCPNPECEYSLYHTELWSLENREQAIIGIRVMLPLFPTTSITYVPKYELNDFLLLLLSCMGTWLGISLFDFNPAKLCNSSKKCDCNDNLRRLSLKCQTLAHEANDTRSEMEEFREEMKRLRAKIDLYEGIFS